MNGPSVTITADLEGAEVSSSLGDRISREEFLSLCSTIIACAVETVEKTWEFAGASPASCRAAAQDAVDRAGRMLNGRDGSLRMTSGRVVSETKGPDPDPSGE